jgi:hypothetical protein
MSEEQFQEVANKDDLKEGGMLKVSQWKTNCPIYG